MQAVCSIAALDDGDMRGFVVNGVAVLVCQREGQFYAIEDQCTHARQLLSEGRLRGYEVSCPLHGARFDVRTGKCTAAPAKRDAKSFPVTLEGGKVHVTVLDSDRPPKPKFGPVV